MEEALSAAGVPLFRATGAREIACVVLCNTRFFRFILI
jgi:hypothetical protein